MTLELNYFDSYTKWRLLHILDEKGESIGAIAAAIGMRHDVLANYLLGTKSELSRQEVDDILTHLGVTKAEFKTGSKGYKPQGIPTMCCFDCG